MNTSDSHAHRKDEQLRICLEEDVSSSLNSGFDALRLVHNALPERDLNEVELKISFLGKLLSAPILISSMTGGSAHSAEFNRVLAEAAESTNLALGLGSGRAGLEDASTANSFLVRKIAPNALILANIGAVQLNYGYDAEKCQKVVDQSEADGLIFHLNPLQEALQSHGDLNWSGLLKKIGSITRKLKVPVIVKEVGWGINGKLAKALEAEGVAAIDVAGAGGTSWSQVEMYRQSDPVLQRVAADFRGWGQTTVEALMDAKETWKVGIPVIASGGLRNGIDLAKCLALGASLGGFARPFLLAASKGVEPLIREIEIIKKELQITLFLSGCSAVKACTSDILAES